MKRLQNKSKQSGMALVMALIMLLLVTILGVSAVKNSALDTQIAGNSIYTSLAFQAAESAIGRSIAQENILDPATNRTVEFDITGAYINPAGETINAGTAVVSKGKTQFDGILEGPVINGVANSSEFKYQVIKFNAESTIKATSVKDEHTEARAVQMPSS